ncbi:glutaredoxin family protein [Shewanella cyperi]|uniref:Glutaredoxin family protein n=1 Tax=Shewanella cyperi TaxID=2814292 RepID=A0A974XHN9_9GAMM|nr:glutaredoxin family protein [Shewanella cyperi]QSX28595.1 glutaredoxin family protein [Shewanella cyperi]
MPEALQSLDFILYHTEGCHLCHEAQALLEQAGIAYRLQDICDDEQLAERYGIRIPVLRCNHSGAELGWPFDLTLLLDFAGA